MIRPLRRAVLGRNGEPRTLQQRFAAMTAAVVALAVAVVGMIAYVSTSRSLYGQVDDELVSLAGYMVTPIASDVTGMGGLNSSSLQAANVNIVLVKSDRSIVRVQGEKVSIQPDAPEVAVARMKFGKSTRTVSLGPDGQRYQQGDLNGLYSLKSNQLSITTVCKHPEVVLRWADQFYTGEASIQNFWGGLGEVTTANADGTYTLNNPPEGTSADAWYWDRSLRDFGPKYCSVEFDKKIILDPTEGDGLKVAMDAETAQYVRPCFPELKYTADEYNELSFLQADIDTYVDTTRARWVAEGGIDEEWDAYVEQLKTMGLEDMNKIYEGAYARYLAAQD